MYHHVPLANIRESDYGTDTLMSRFAAMDTPITELA